MYGRPEQYVYRFVIRVRGDTSPELTVSIQSNGGNSMNVTVDPLRRTRDFLYQVRDGDRRIRNLEKRIQLRQDALDLAGERWNDADVTEKEIMALEHMIEREKADYAAAVVDVSDTISCLEDDNQQMVLTYRYIDMISDWCQIADRMGMKKAAVQKLHGRALPKLKEVLEQK